MINYIATFFTHYDALVFLRMIEKNGICGECVPVPRTMSSSCGTAVRFCAAEDNASAYMLPDVEQLAYEANGKYISIFDNR